MKKILIIDDEQEMIDVLSGFLLQRDYSVATAVDGEDGLKKFDETNPDLVLCDIRMPKKDGFEFLKDVRSSKRWVPIIIISALSEPVNVLKGYDFQADYYLTKPLDLNEMLKAIEIMLSLAPMRKDQP